MKIFSKALSGVFILAVLISIIPFSGCALITGEDTANKDNRFMELLSLIPASAADRGAFLLIDYDKCFKEVGFSLNDTGDTRLNRELLRQSMFSNHDPKRDMTKLNFVGLGSYFTGFGQYIFISPISSDNTGYEFTDARAEILDGWQYSLFTDFDPYLVDNTASFNHNSIVAAIGNYSMQKMQTAFTHQAGWAPWAIEKYATEDYRNIPIYSWGNVEERHSMRDQPLVDRFGRAFPVATDNEHLFIGSSTDEIKAMIAASQNQGLSLADIPEYALLAQGLNALNVSVAVISAASLHNVNATDKFVQQYPILPYIIMGEGIGEDGKGSFLVQIFIQLSSDEAVKNSQLFRERIYGKFTRLEPINGDWDHFYSSSKLHDLVEVSRSISDRFSQVDIWAQDRAVFIKYYSEDTDLLIKSMSCR
jgi:hypothetical protein